MTDIPSQLADIASRIDNDEDYAMRIGEDARATLESEGLPDVVIAAVLAEAEAEVAGFALGVDDAAATVTRIADACRQVSTNPPI